MENNVQKNAMVTYIGTKMIKARPMTRKQYNDYRGWKLPDDEDGSDMGYLVEYLDSPNSNHSNHAGYISWSPENVFNTAYRRVEGMSFGLAIEAMKRGMKVARTGWNGKNMFIFIREGRLITGVDPSSPMGEDFESRAHICMKDAQGKCVVGWLASQTDMLSDDWEIVR
jgi:hypothetical protein